MTEYMRKRLARAAALRVNGVDWARVAAAVASRPEVCRRWPARYPAEWEALVAAAFRGLLAEAQAEARQVLAELARWPDGRVR